MRFQELTDEQREFVKPSFPLKAKVGSPRADDRKTINGILYVLTTGCRWMDTPKEYGPTKRHGEGLRNGKGRGYGKGFGEGFSIRDMRRETQLKKRRDR